MQPRRFVRGAETTRYAEDHGIDVLNQYRTPSVTNRNESIGRSLERPGNAAPTASGLRSMRSLRHRTERLSGHNDRSGECPRADRSWILLVEYTRRHYCPGRLPRACYNPLFKSIK